MSALRSFSGGKAEVLVTFANDVTLSRRHAALIPANLITLAHLSVSSAMSLPKSAGEPARAVPPRSASRDFQRDVTYDKLLPILSAVAEFYRSLEVKYQEAGAAAPPLPAPHASEDQRLPGRLTLAGSCRAISSGLAGTLWMMSLAQ